MKNQLPRERLLSANGSELLIRHFSSGEDRIPRPKHLAAAIAQASDDWFRQFIGDLKLRATRRANRAIEASARHDPTYEGLEEELHQWDDLAEEFGLSKEQAYRDIRKVLELRREQAPGPHVSQSVPMAFTNLLHVVRGLTQDFRVTFTKELEVAIENAQRHLDMFGADADPGVGVCKEDSAALQELREIIDARFGWRTTAEKEAGNYVTRLLQVANYVAHAGATRRLWDEHMGERK